jgi:hypothetical protein
LIVVAGQADANLLEVNAVVVQSGEGHPPKVMLLWLGGFRGRRQRSDPRFGAAACERWTSRGGTDRPHLRPRASCSHLMTLGRLVAACCSGAVATTDEPTDALWGWQPMTRPPYAVRNCRVRPCWRHLDDSAQADIPDFGCKWISCLPDWSACFRPRWKLCTACDTAACNWRCLPGFCIEGTSTCGRALWRLSPANCDGFRRLAAGNPGILRILTDSRRSAALVGRAVRFYRYGLCTHVRNERH